jgi:alanine dehydrogenase
MPLLLTTEETKQLVTMREAIDLLEEGYKSLARHEATHRPRTDMQVPLRPGEDYWLATMEGASRHHGLAAVRLRSDRFSTRSKKWAGRPGMFCGLVLLYDLESGELAAIINDGYLQLMRVSATSALAGRYLARPESRVLGIIGSGWQARDHARAFSASFPLEHIRVFSPSEARRDAFALEMSAELGLRVTAESSAREAVEGCDIVATCTDSSTPVMETRWLAPGTYVSSLRYYKEMAEPRDAAFDVHVIHYLPGYVQPAYRAGTQDQWDQGADIYTTYDRAEPPAGSVQLQDVVGGRCPGRTSARQRTVFINHGGMGIQFVALGRVVLDRARERSLGRELPAEWFLQDVTT